MKLKELIFTQIVFLEEQELDPSYFKFIRATRDDFIFYNKRLKKIVEIRR